MMEFKPITTSPIEILNFPTLEDNKNQKHGALLPPNIRCLIVGSPGSGKTNVLLNLLISSDGLHFKNIYVYSKTLFQKKNTNFWKVL